MIPWTDVVAWAAAFVAIWWVVDYLSLRQEGERLPLRRDPLGMLVEALRRLGRNRSFLLVMVGLWLVIAGLHYYGAYQIRQHATQRREPARSALKMLGPLTDAVPQLIEQQVPESLPRVVPLRRALPTELAALLFILATIVLNIRPPAAIGVDVARRLIWPAVMLVIAMGTEWGLPVAMKGVMDGAGLTTRSGIYLGVITGLWFAFLAPVAALLWRLVLDIMDTGRASLNSAATAVTRSWLPIALVLLLVTNAVGFIVLFPNSRGYGSAAGIVYLLLGVLFVFVPWVIVDRQEGFIAALRESWRLFRPRWFEVITFGLRFTLLFAVLRGIVAAVEPIGLGRLTAWYAPLLGMVGSFLVLLQMMTIAGLYVTLRDERAAGISCAACVAEDLAAEDESTEA